jgi:hypothetical protein
VFICVPFDQAEEATVAAVVMRTPDYDKLLEYGLDQRVAEKLDEIYKVPYRFMSTC